MQVGAPSQTLARLLGTREPAVPVLSAAQIAHARRTRLAVDPARLKSIVSELAEPRSRISAPEGMVRAERFVSETLESAGWRVDRCPFTLRNERASLDTPFGKEETVYPKLEGANLLAVRDEPSRDAVFVVAHLDTVRESPGADDNGSGLAVLLEVARLLPRMTHQTVVLAVVDFEEIGMVGSRVLVERQLGPWNVQAAVVLDTVGFRSSEAGSQRVPGGIGTLYPDQVGRMGERAAGDFVAVLYRNDARRLASAFTAWLRGCSPETEAILVRDPADLPVVGGALRLVPGARNFARSDHKSFWDAGLPSVMLTDMANFRNPNYHLPADLPATLDYDFLADVAAATLLTVQTLSVVSRG